jgi:hypothetical protein
MWGGFAGAALQDDLETVVWCRKPQWGDDEENHAEKSAGWSTTVSVSLKHYLGYPNPISGKDRTEAWVSLGLLQGNQSASPTFGFLDVPDPRPDAAAVLCPVVHCGGPGRRAERDDQQVHSPIHAFTLGD